MHAPAGWKVRFRFGGRFRAENVANLSLDEVMPASISPVEIASAIEPILDHGTHDVICCTIRTRQDCVFLSASQQPRLVARAFRSSGRPRWTTLIHKHYKRYPGAD